MCPLLLAVAQATCSILQMYLMRHADAALAASVFHYKEIEIPDLKQFLSGQNINVRI